jgi:hypothetical protein
MHVCLYALSNISLNDSCDYLNDICLKEPGVVEHLSQNVTRQGLTDNTLHFLQVRVFNEFPYIVIPVHF